MESPSDKYFQVLLNKALNGQKISSDEVNTVTSCLLSPLPSRDVRDIAAEVAYDIFGDLAFLK